MSTKRLWCVVCTLTLSLMVGRSRRRIKRKATTGRMQRSEVRRTVSQMLGWLREFLATPGISETVIGIKK